MTTCRHCGRLVFKEDGGLWVDPEATGDDSVWRETCDSHDTFTAYHEPVVLEAATLTPGQQETVEHFKGYAVPASWFVGEADESGRVEVVAVGEGFVWSFLIEADGDCSSSEARLGEFSTGIVI